MCKKHSHKMLLRKLYHAKFKMAVLPILLFSVLTPSGGATSKQQLESSSWVRIMPSAAEHS